MNNLVHERKISPQAFGYSYNELLAGNHRFVKDSLAQDRHFFDKLSAGQQPEVLWIGCADSRVPANEVTLAGPGQIFEHRNIANVCQHTDINLLSVLDYAVNSLKVKHIIVAGHYRCGGVFAALKGEPVGLIDHWLLPIRDVYEQHENEIDTLPTETDRWDKLVELNVLQQVYNLSRTPVINHAWASGSAVVIHGWVIDLQSGLVKEMYQSDAGFRDQKKIWVLEGDLPNA